MEENNNNLTWRGRLCHSGRENPVNGKKKSWLDFLRVEISILFDVLDVEIIIFYEKR